MNQMNLSVIVPAYNEEQNIVKLLKDIFLVLKENKYNNEIIVVDDCSDDNTLQVCYNLKNDIPNLKIIRHSERQGKSDAIQSGVNHAKNKFIIMIDADYQYDPKDIPKIIKKFEEGYEFITGWRAKRRDSKFRLLLSFIFNIINRILFGIRVHDINCGLKGFTKNLFMKIKLEFPKWFMDVELIAKAYTMNISITEVIINHYPRKHGRSKIKFIETSLETLINSLKLKYSLLRI